MEKAVGWVFPESGRITVDNDLSCSPYRSRGAGTCRGFFLEGRELQQPLEERTSERLKTIQGLH